MMKNIRTAIPEDQFAKDQVKDGESKMAHADSKFEVDDRVKVVSRREGQHYGKVGNIREVNHVLLSDTHGPSESGKISESVWQWRYNVCIDGCLVKALHEDRLELA